MNHDGEREKNVTQHYQVAVDQRRYPK